MILVMIVKDNNNILPYEIWSIDYKGSLPFGYYENNKFRLTSSTLTKYTYSNEYSSIGEYSIKQEVAKTQYMVLFDNEINLNKSYQLKVHVCSNVSVIIYFIAGTSTKNILIKHVGVPKNSANNYSLAFSSSEFTGEEVILQGRVMPLEDDGIVYIDDWCLTEN